MKHLFILPLLLATAAPPAVAVEAAPASGTVIRLSAAEIQALEVARLKRAAAPETEPAPTAETSRDRQPDRKIHGEVGFGLGSGGYSEVAGTMVAPLGDQGFVAFSFQRQRSDGRRFHRR